MVTKIRLGPATRRGEGRRGFSTARELELVARQDGTTYYRMGIVIWADQDDLVYLEKFESDVATAIGAQVNVGTVSAGDQFGMRLLGETIELYRNGELLAAHTDSSISGNGAIGIGLWGAPTPGAWDDFGGGDAKP
jgi:hypothetical protein